MGHSPSRRVSDLIPSSEGSSRPRVSKRERQKHLGIIAGGGELWVAAPVELQQPSHDLVRRSHRNPSLQSVPRPAERIGANLPARQHRREIAYKAGSGILAASAAQSHRAPEGTQDSSMDFSDRFRLAAKHLGQHSQLTWLVGFLLLAAFVLLCFAMAIAAMRANKSESVETDDQGVLKPVLMATAQSLPPQSPPPQHSSASGSSSSSSDMVPASSSFGTAAAPSSFWVLLCGYEHDGWSPFGLDTPVKKVVFVLYLGLSLAFMVSTRYIVGIGPNIYILILVSLIGKTVISVGLWRVYDGTFTDLVTKALAHGGLMLGYSLLAVAYLAADFMRIDIVQKTNPSTFDVLVNLRTITTVLLWEVIMGKRLSGQQWLAIITICLGCLVKEFPNLHKTSAPGAAERWRIYMEMGGFLLCSSMAAVVNERFLKHHSPAPVNLQNLALYLFSIVAVLLAAVGAGPTSYYAGGSPLAWSQWSLLAKPAVIIQVLSLTLLGLVTSHFLRRLSNVTKEVAAAIELLVVVPMDKVLFGANLGFFEVAGAGLAILGVGIFSRCPTDAGEVQQCGAGDHLKNSPVTHVGVPYKKFLPAPAGA